LKVNTRGQTEAAASVSVPLIKKALRPRWKLEFSNGMFTPSGHWV
jgi:hypothetical protein